eukprot:TRINITY_DN3152_c0_g1_i2.p1 TRINITY_DN3152_c0_g1~~TRINITY_DN3152_c0_g1_i2.p1  ORF type:complete len:139 (-),score=17.84 TRINITY_DN3152_c0_g1_i2:19-435(-)
MSRPDSGPHSPPCASSAHGCAHELLLQTRKMLLSDMQFPQAAASVKTVMQGIGSFIFSGLLARFIGQGGAPPLLDGRLPGGHWLLASVLSAMAMVAARRSFARHHKARGAVSDMDAAEARERGGSHPEMVELLRMPPQ